MPHQPFGRRAFLGVAGAGAASAAARTDALLLPLVSLGAKRVSRLIAGANPVNGYSHCTQRLSELMVQYFTVERTTGFLLHCERQGINTWQSSYSPKVRDALRAAREQGSKIQFICLTSGSHKESLEDVLALDPIARRVERAGQPVELTQKEFALLEYLMRNAGRLVTRQQITAHVWKQGPGAEPGNTTNVVDVYINYLRKKLDGNRPTPLIQTIRRSGYILTED